MTDAQRNWHRRNRERLNEYHRNWRESNREHFNAYHRNYRRRYDGKTVDESTINAIHALAAQSQGYARRVRERMF